MASSIVPGNYIQFSPYRASSPGTPAPWLARAQQALAPAPAEEIARIEAMEMLLSGAVSGGTGLALGVLQAELKDGLDFHKVPLDFVGYITLGIAGYAFNSPALVASSNSCFTVLSFRKTIALLGALDSLMGKSSVTVSGESVDEKPAPEPEPEKDPIVAAGESLDD